MFPSFLHYKKNMNSIEFGRNPFQKNIKNCLMDEIFVSPVFGGMVQTSIEIIPNSLSKWFVQGALDRFPSDRCDLYRDLYLYLDIPLSYLIH